MAQHNVTHQADDHTRNARPATRARQWGSALRIRPQTLGLSPLLALTRALSDLLVPVRPRAEFRAELQRSLLVSARQQCAKRQLSLSTRAAGGRTPANPSPARIPGWSNLEGVMRDKRWVWGAAAAGSAVSLAGILAYVVRQQHNRPAASV